ncbi:MAG: hypothetical protein ACREEH_01510, partial [Caulobacteraceae bacterium]
QTPWAARADADDLNLEGRFSDQIAFLARHPEVDVLGGAIIEFWPWGAERMKSLPLDHEAICAFARFRSPINHMTAFIRARAFRDAGGYPPIDWAEDYGLWLRMLATGARFANLAAPLVRARLGDDFLARRTGSKALAAEAALWGLKRRTPGMGVFSTGAIFWARCAALAFPLPARAAYWALRR